MFGSPLDACNIAELARMVLAKHQMERTTLPWLECYIVG